MTTLDTFDSFSLQNDAFTTIAGQDFVHLLTGDLDVRATEMRYADPVFSGQTRRARQVTVNHQITCGANSPASRLALKAFYRDSRGPAWLVWTDDDGITKRTRVKLVRLLPHPSGIPTLAQGTWLVLSHVHLANEDDDVAAAAKTSTPASVSVENPGTVNSPAVIYTLQPTVAKTAANGQRFRLFCTVANPAPVDLVRHSIEVTNGGWNHAAEVTATRSQADGDDVEVYRDHVRLMRYFGVGTAAVNQAATKVWIADDLAAERKWAHQGAAVAAGATTYYTSTPLSHMPPLPFWGMLSSGAGNEVVQVTAYDEASGAITIGRGKRGSTDLTHSGTHVLRYAVAYDLVYGGTSLAAPRYINNDYRPVPADHQSSTNAVHHYSVYQETPAAADTQARKPRPGGWRTARRPSPDWTGREDMYGNWIPRTASRTTDAASASAMAIVYRADGPMAGHPLIDRWEIYTGIAISTVAFNQDTTTLEQLVPNEGRLFLLGYAKDGSEVRLGDYNNSSTSESITPAQPVRGVAFAVRPHDPKDPQDNPSGSSVGSHEPTDDDGILIGNGAATVLTFETAEALILSVSSRQDCYQIGRPDAPATLANEENEILSIYGPVLALNQVLTIDVEARTATLDDGTSVAQVLRGAWPGVPTDPGLPPSLPYPSEIIYTEAGLAGGASITIGVPSYRGAWL